MRRGNLRLGRLVLGAAMVFAAITGCDSLPESHRVTTIPERVVVPEGTAVVAVRWPLSITEPAYEIIAERFRSLSRSEAREAYRGIPDKSTYYALELYSYLRAYLGNDAVLLEPYVVSPGADGRLKYDVILQSAIPVAFVVDVVEPPYWFIGGWGMGHVVVTNFAVSVAPAISPQTCGLISRQAWRADDFRHLDVHPTTGAQCQAESPREGPHYTYLDNLAKARPEVLTEFPRSQLPPLRANSVMTWPTGGWELSKDYVRSSVRAPFKVNRENPDNFFAVNMARAITQAAGAMDLKGLTQGGWTRQAHQYEPQTSMALSDGVRRRALEVLAEAEKKWIVRQDEKLAEALLNGRFGKSFRQNRVAEMAVRDRVARQALASAFTTFTLGMNTGLFGGNVPYNPMALAQGMAENLSAQADFHRDLQSFIAMELGPEAAARDHMVQVEIAGVVQKISADSRLNLREQLKRLYGERFARGK